MPRNNVFDKLLSVVKSPDVWASLTIIVVAFMFAALSVAWKGYNLERLSTVLIGDHLDSLSNAAIIEQAMDNLMHRIDDLGYGRFYTSERAPMAYTIAPYGIAIVLLPLYLLTGSNIDLTLNIYLFATFSLNAWAFYLLARYLFNASAGICFLAGLVIAFCQFRFYYLTRIESLSTQYFFLSIYCLHRLIDDPRPRWAIGLAITFWLGFFSTGYFGFYFIFLGPIILLYAHIVRRIWPSRKLMRNLLLSAIIAIVLSAPFAQIRLDANQRGQGSGIIDGYNISDMLMRAPRLNQRLSGTSWLYESLFPHAGIRTTPIEIVPLLLTVLAWFYLRRYSPPETTDRGGQLPKHMLTTRQLVVLYTLIALVGVFLSIGPYFVVNDSLSIPSPYLLLARLPGFSSIRELGRAMLITVMATVLLSVFALVELSHRVSKRRFRLVFWVVIVAFLVELFPTNSSFTLTIIDSTRHAPVTPILSTRPQIPYNAYQWLAQRPPDTVVFHYPMDITSNRLYMYGNRFNQQPMINGSGSFFPKWYLDIHWSEFPDTETLQALAKRQVKYILVHTYLLQPTDEAALQEKLKPFLEIGLIGLVTRIDDVEIYRTVFPPVP